jgi:phage shock protein A
MDFFRKLMMLIRGSSRELGEAVLDSQGMRIQEQEIENAKIAVKQAETELTAIMTKEMRAGREIERLNDEIAVYEAKALIALEKGEESLAGEIADKIAKLEQEQERHQTSKKQLSKHILSTKEILKQTHTKIREYEREISMVKTTESVQKAAKSIDQYIDGGHYTMIAARESLDRIKHRQQDEQDRMAAMAELKSELHSESLEARLKAAGIGDEFNRSKRILERLKTRQQDPEN